MLSHTSFNITESRRRVGGGETFVSCGVIVVEEEGISVLGISIAANWFGATKGSSWTNSKTNGEDESKIVPVWIGCSSSASESVVIMKSDLVESTRALTVASEVGKATLMGWGSIVAFEAKAGRATMICDSTRVCSSETKVSASNVDWSGIWGSGWIWFRDSGLSSGCCCCWGLPKVTSSEAISEALSGFAT